MKVSGFDLQALSFILFYLSFFVLIVFLLQEEHKCQTPIASSGYGNKRR